MVGMTMIDLLRLLRTMPLVVLLSIHRTQGDEICGRSAIQPPCRSLQPEVVGAEGTPRLGELLRGALVEHF